MYVHLPGYFFSPSPDSTADPASYVTHLKSTMQQLRATSPDDLLMSVQPCPPAHMSLLGGMPPRSHCSHVMMVPTTCTSRQIFYGGCQWSSSVPLTGSSLLTLNIPQNSQHLLPLTVLARLLSPQLYHLLLHPHQVLLSHLFRPYPTCLHGLDVVFTGLSIWLITFPSSSLGGE